MNWKLLVTRSARKDLVNLPDKEQARIERTLEALEKDPFSGNVKR
jgi:mRNA-degrading endonuclease RelE of RelBE toxin-antitoxin system